MELTTALDQVKQKDGLLGVKLDGKMLNVGVPSELRNTLSNF